MAEVDPPSTERAWFQRWRKPAEFAARIEMLKPKTQKALRSDLPKFWREGWIAANFAMWAADHATRLRLTPDGADWGDFQIQDTNGEFFYEVTEALDPAIMSAFKSLEAERKNLRLVESEDTSASALARRLVLHLISEKAKNLYPAGTSLIIYKNLRTDFLQEAPPVPQGSHRFRTIWIFKDGGALQIFPLLRRLRRFGHSPG